MKNIIASLLAASCISGFAHASPIVVWEAPVNEYETVTAQFAFDSKLGRAWVDVEKVDSQFEALWSTGRVKVDGLFYDSVAKQVLYRSGDRRIVCGQVTSFLGLATVHPTGSCQLYVSSDDRRVDDGFGSRDQTFARVTLDPGE